MLSLTDRCQSLCTYCQIPQRQKKEMTTKQIRLLIDQIIAEGCERIALWGGEPLLRKDIGDIIRYCKSKNLYVTMDTNGFLIEKHLEEIANLDVLLISWDGPEQAHEANRIPNSYDRVVDAIKIAKEKVKVWTLTVLTKHNINRINEILEIGGRLDVPMLFQLLYHNQDQSGNTSNLLPSRQEHLDAFKRLIEAKKKGIPIVNSYAYLKHLTSWKDFSKQTQSFRKRGYPLCRAGQFFCNVDVDGKVYPCNRLVEQVGAKSFLDVGFKEAFGFTSRNGCESCITPGIEFSLMFSFDIASIVNWINFILKTQSRPRQDQ
ncbi:MAG: radical SAM/SPASM domain-containing protein [Candidatus Scalinduaceae bacterium]